MENEVFSVTVVNIGPSGEYWISGAHDDEIIKGVAHSKNMLVFTTAQKLKAALKDIRDRGYRPISVIVQDHSEDQTTFLVVTELFAGAAKFNKPLPLGVWDGDGRESV